MRAVSLCSLALLSGCGLVLDAAPPRGDAGPSTGLDARVESADTGVIAADAWAADDAHVDANRPRVDGGDLDAPRTDAGLDASVFEGDATVGPLCEGAVDGAACGDAPRRICVAGACVLAECGDGFVDLGEDCEPVRDGPGCNPLTCRWQCLSDPPCSTGTPCVAGSCGTDHMCHYVNVSGTCTSAMGATGICAAGECAPPTCNGVLEAGEECDNVGPGCTACHFDCHGDDECQDGDPCNGREVCLDRLDGGRVVGRRCAPDPEPSLCVSPACFVPSCTALDADHFRCDDILVGDTDGDGFVAEVSCGSVGGDCAEGDPERHPGALETCNGLDDDCDGRSDEGMPAMARYCPDEDGDGFGDPTHAVFACARPAGAFVSDTLCVDCFDVAGAARATAALVNPAQTGFFATPYVNAFGATSFDYDCSGRNEQEIDNTIECAAILRLGCNTARGWQDRVPGCGEVAAFATCRGIGPLLCGADVVTRTQRCH